jgi:SET domain-containing protein
MPPVEGLRVGHSAIHGYGVYATRPFRRGEVIIHADGVIYREHDTFDDEYALILPGYEPGPDGDEGPPIYYDLADQTRWINHSCDPNSEVDSRWDPELRMAYPWWVALCDIAAGEEITYDYAFAGHLAVPCACGARACRGVIVDPDEIDQVPAQYRHLVRQDLLVR